MLWFLGVDENWAGKLPVVLIRIRDSRELMIQSCIGLTFSIPLEHTAHRRLSSVKCSTHTTQ